MDQPSAPPIGLPSLIRTALTFAIQAGRHEAVTSLEAALTAIGDTQPVRYELDILAGQVRIDGKPAKLSRGDRALLIFLALARRPCTRDELCEMLYPHLDGAVAATQLKVYIHRVRRRLGDPRLIVYQAESYRLGPAVIVDYWDVEAQIAEAMRANGGLSPEQRARLSAIRERLIQRDTSWCGGREWCCSLERRLESLLFDVVTRLGEAALCEHDLGSAIRMATDIFSLDPCDERGAELAIRAHLKAGDHPAAIRCFRRYERTLKAEFGTPASPELTALVSGAAG